MLNEKLASLQKQFLLADRLKLHVEDSDRLQNKFSNGNWLRKRAIRIIKKLFGSSWEKIIFSSVSEDEKIHLFIFQSSLIYMTIFYGLVYTTAEAWVDFKLKNEEVDELLKDNVKFDQLKKFRNATFHVQNEFISSKHLNFLEQRDSEIWIKRLHKALGKAISEHPDVKLFFDKGFEWAKEK